MEVPDETPWTCRTCGARAYDIEGWGINPDHTLYCEQCEATPVKIKHDEPGRIRLPQEVAEQWDTKGYGSATQGQMYNVLWWLADNGYSIVPDAQVDKWLEK